MSIHPDGTRRAQDGAETILVTGGAGFVGANVVRYLLERGFRVRVLDNFSSGDRDSLAGLDVVTVTGDIRDRATVDQAIMGCSSVIHLAASTSVLESVKDPQPTFSVNAAGTLTLIQAAVQVGVGKFILASSNAVLGEQPPPLHERLVPAPLSPYGASKLAAEAYCSAAHGSYGIDVAILRFANVYGPFCTLKTSVVAKYLRLLEAREPITIYGDGSQTRDFIYVDDVARAIMLALEKPAGCVTLQIGTGRETSIRELASMLIDLTNSPSTIEHTPPQRGEIHRNYASIERARSVLGFEPEWDLREGLQETIAWLNSASSAANVSG